MAKWLRIMGYDTIFAHPVEDGELVRIAQREGRILLTRDTQVAKRTDARRTGLRVILIESERLQDQLLQIVRDLNLDQLSHRFSRCIECNEILVPKAKDQVRDMVPPYVFQTQEQYMQCPRCGRIYWKGTHWARMTAELRALASEGFERKEAS